MKPIQFPVFLLIMAVSALQCTSDSSANSSGPDPGDEDPADAFEQNQRLGRGINLGNALEADNEGDWGVIIEDRFFEIIACAGFSHVRLPVKWSAHTGTDQPYDIDPDFMSRIHHLAGIAIENDLLIIINCHHFEEIYENPAGQLERFLSIWQQTASSFADYGSSILFEILNEPRDNLTAAVWNDYLQQAVELIRTVSPERTLLVGTAEWGGLASLDDLMLPEDDNIIVTFHYYNPFEFTHQGADWVTGADSWLGTTWTQTGAQRLAVQQDLDLARTWADANNRPLHMGEFGSYEEADMNSRTAWTRFVTEQAELRDISWAYWEFCSGFAAYDLDQDQWIWDLLNALIPGTLESK